MHPCCCCCCCCCCSSSSHLRSISVVGGVPVSRSAFACISSELVLASSTLASCNCRFNSCTASLLPWMSSPASSEAALASAALVFPSLSNSSVSIFSRSATFAALCSSSSSWLCAHGTGRVGGTGTASHGEACDGMGVTAWGRRQVWSSFPSGQRHASTSTATRTTNSTGSSP